MAPPRRHLRVGDHAADERPKHRHAVRDRHVMVARDREMHEEGAQADGVEQVDRAGPD